MLGKGLESLIPPKKEIKEENKEEVIFRVGVEEIKPNPYQPRKELDENSLNDLCQSMETFGILQPLVVRKVERFSEKGTIVEYELIAGQRRLEAAKKLHFRTVPVVIKEIEVKSEQLEMALVENLQRQSLNLIEEAKVFEQLSKEFNFSQKEIASRVGKSREYVANSLRLLSLPENIQKAVAQGKIKGSQARIILSKKSEEERQELFSKIINKKSTVKETKKIFSKNESEINPEFTFLKNKMEDYLQAKVNISFNGKSGKIMIKFFSKDELERLVEKICSEE